MLIKSTSGVLASVRSSTYPTLETSCLGSSGWAGEECYASRPSLAAALPAERCVLARRGWAGEKVAFLSIPRECPPVMPHARSEGRRSGLEVPNTLLFRPPCIARVSRLRLSSIASTALAICITHYSLIADEPCNDTGGASANGIANHPMESHRPSIRLVSQPAPSCFASFSSRRVL
jgi:hypothetical protein